METHLSLDWAKDFTAGNVGNHFGPLEKCFEVELCQNVGKYCYNAKGMLSHLNVKLGRSAIERRSLELRIDEILGTDRVSVKKPHHVSCGDPSVIEASDESSHVLSRIGDKARWRGSLGIRSANKSFCVR